MTLLALEFSSAVRSVAIANHTSVEGSAQPATAILATATDANRSKIAPLGLIREALDAARLLPEAIDAIAVGLGPGSYTGIRSAIALAQGWELAHKFGAVGVSSADVIAGRAAALGWNGGFRVVIDAQRGELYVAAYAIEAGRFRETEALHLEPRPSPGQLASAVQCIGPGADQWFSDGHHLPPDAATVAMLAQHPPKSARFLEPIYLRAPSFVKSPPVSAFG